MFHRVTRASIAAIGLAAVLAAPMAWSWDAPPVRVRGTIERSEGPVFVVKSRDGAELKVVLAENAVAAGVVKATLADIKQGSFVGIAAMPQPDGAQRALEVLIFPEAMRGTGEGHYPWDLQPKSTMTNANVEHVVTTSTQADAPHGMEFLYSLNRLNVATSRARCICILVASPDVFEPECRTPRQIQLANAFCRYRELAEALDFGAP
jgi:hypothetical protein